MTRQTQKYGPSDEQELMSALWDPQIVNNPYNFVMFNYPWGKKGTPLERFKGPRNWQRDILESVADHIASNIIRMELGLSPQVYQDSTVSGRGIGKSSLVAWLNNWIVSCVLGSSAITTANTETQLKTRTWAELGKWTAMSLNSHWFDKGSLDLKPASWLRDAVARDLGIDSTYWYAMGQLWSEENPDAFAGVHNMAGTLLQFDEASGIPGNIWDVSDGFFTEPVLHRYWFAYSNGRRNTGMFYETHHKYRGLWVNRSIDSRTVEGTDQEVYAKIIRKYGEDSDQARIEVKGGFPRTGEDQFIGREVVEEAQQRELFSAGHSGLIMGVDPARFGDDSTFIVFRQGRDYRTYPRTEMKGKDNMAVADKCAELINKYNPDAVCIDAGNGTGVIDRLRQMGYKVNEIWFGSKGKDEQYKDRRTELWAHMREWLKEGCIHDGDNLRDDLVGPSYGYVGNDDQLKLESKKKMKGRGLPSPDEADALACTFAVKTARKDLHASKNNPNRRRSVAKMDSNPLGR